jgi:hypothetical protein
MWFPAGQAFARLPKLRGQLLDADSRVNHVAQDGFARGLAARQAYAFIASVSSALRNPASCCARS